REDGIHTFLTVKFPILDSAGRITGVGAIGTDITERKRVEEALERLKQQNELILSSAGEGIYGLDTQGRSTFVNPAAAKMIGWDAEDLIGKPQHDILHHTKADGSPYPREECPIYAVFKDGGVHHVTDEVFWRKDGSSFPVEYVSTPIREHGEITGAVVIFRDISDRKRAEEAMRTAKEQAEVANRTKSEFLANMSHELRTPLNAIIGFSELIESEILGPVGNGSYRDYAGDIRESGRHLLDLINDILDLSKVESGSDELLEESIEVAEATRSVLMMVKRRAEKGGVELETEVPDDLPPLRADSRKLKQILVNLLSNGVKFTDTGGRVTLRAWCRPDSGHVFQIVDTGIGISLQDIPKALSPFQQIDSELNRKYEGTGLGLPLTKALVELHGGTLDLQSQVGIGTTVTVRFPAERVAVLRDDAGPLAAKAS
ncbi:MAG: ATP-binding protein, partial [Kiloniellales bacterium]